MQAISHFWDSQFNLKNSFDLNDEEYRLIVTGLGWSGYHMIRQWIVEDYALSPEELLNLFQRMISKKQ